MASRSNDIRPAISDTAAATDSGIGKDRLLARFIERVARERIKTGKPNRGRKTVPIQFGKPRLKRAALLGESRAVKRSKTVQASSKTPKTATNWVTEPIALRHPARRAASAPRIAIKPAIAISVHHGSAKVPVKGSSPGIVGLFSDFALPETAKRAASGRVIWRRNALRSKALVPHPAVMAGLGPAIHVLLSSCGAKDVDGKRNSGLPELRVTECGKSGIPDLR